MTQHDQTAQEALDRILSIAYDFASSEDEQYELNQCEDILRKALQVAPPVTEGKNFHSEKWLTGTQPPADVSEDERVRNNAIRYTTIILKNMDHNLDNAKLHMDNDDQIKVYSDNVDAYKYILSTLTRATCSCGTKPEAKSDERVVSRARAKDALDDMDNVSPMEFRNRHSGVVRILLQQASER